MPTCIFKLIVTFKNEHVLQMVFQKRFEMFS